MSRTIFKRTAAVLLCLCMLFSLLPMVVGAASYPDIKSGAWYYSAVNYISNKGYMTGYKSGLFGPSDNMQRQDFVVTLARISTVDLNKFSKGNGGFNDVPSGTYYAPSVSWAVNNNIINGYDNSTFGVGDKINREQVCTILWRYMGSPSVSNVSSTLSAYPDRGQVSSFAKNAVAWAIQKGILSGMQNGTLAPSGYAARAQIATILMRMDQKGMFATKRYTGVTPSMTPSQAVDIYMSYKSTWMTTSFDSYMAEYSYIFLDLDFDGVLELLCTSIAGSGRFSDNRFYRINPSTKRVEQLNGMSEVDYESMDTVLYRSKSDAQMFYVSEDFVRAYSTYYGSSYCKMYMSNATIYEQPLFGYIYDGGTTSYSQYVNDTSQTISQSKYNQRLAALKSDNINMHLNWSKVSAKTFSSSGSSTQRQLLLNSYKAYSYDGFSF